MNHPKKLSRLEGKTVIVTGASDGIGVETARMLAELGATVVLPVRNLEKGRAVRDELVRATKNERIEVEPTDLADLASVRAFASAFRAKHPKLDVLVNNAGLSPVARALTRDGFETTFGVNHLGHFVLTLELLDALKAAAPSRVVVVSSKLHENGVIPFDDLTYGASIGSFMKGAYADSKLANVLFAYELAERLKGTGVTVNALHPGVVSTSLARDMNGFFRWVTKTFFLTPEKGAYTSVYLAASPDVEGVTGKYFEKCREVASSPASHDASLRKRLWDASEKLTGARFTA